MNTSICLFKGPRALAGLVVLAAVLLAGAPAPAQYMRLSDGPYSSSLFGRRSSLTNTIVTPASLSGYVPDDKYKLRIGDKVRFQILEDREFRAGHLHTGFIDEFFERHRAPRPSRDLTAVAALAAALYARSRSRSEAPPGIPESGWLLAGRNELLR